MAELVPSDTLANRENLTNDNFLGLTPWPSGTERHRVGAPQITVITVGHQKKSKSDTCYWSIVWFDPSDLVSAKMGFSVRQAQMSYVEH